MSTVWTKLMFVKSVANSFTLYGGWPNTATCKYFQDGKVCPFIDFVGQFVHEVTEAESNEEGVGRGRGGGLALNH